jgi:hypothetical protein
MRTSPLRFHVGPCRAPWEVVPAIVLVSVCLVLTAVDGAPPPVSRAGSAGTPTAAATNAALTAAREAPAIIIHVPHPTWINVTSSQPTAIPPAAEGGSAAYDPLDHETVYFGGDECAYACTSNQTWVFANATWTNETDAFDAPPAREYASMDYDANMQSILLFGGEDGSGNDLNDTWLFSNGTWTNVSDFGPGPSARYGASMAFDPAPEENGSVLYGGCNPAGCLNDTWVWMSWAGWVPFTGSSLAPPPSGLAAMAYDAADGYIVLITGVCGGFCLTNETWELYSGQWWHVLPEPSPPSTDQESMVYVPSLSGVLLLDGDVFGFAENNDTWLFSNGAWTQEAPATLPPARSNFGLALDGTGTTAIAVGGINVTSSNVYNDTWAYEFTPGVTLAPNQSAAEVAQSVAFTASVGGGTAPYQVTFDFGVGGRDVVVGMGPTISVDQSFVGVGNYSVYVDVIDAVGATTSTNAFTFPVSAGPAVLAVATPSHSDVGSSVAFATALTAPGTSPLTYAWEFGDGANGTGATTSHTFAAAGTYLVTVNATDADHATASAVVTVWIASDPSVSLAASPSVPLPGALTNFYANVTGGTGPYNYSWSFGDGGVSAFPTPQHSFATPGKYTVGVWVNDSAGGSTHASMTVKVVLSSASGLGGLANAPWWYWAGVGLLVVVAIAGTVLLLRRAPSRAP